MRSTTRITQRGEPVSCNDDTALALYEQALTQFQSYRGDPIATIDQARHRPDFVFGPRPEAMLFMTSRAALRRAGRVGVASAGTAAAGQRRERALGPAARALVNGDWGGRHRTRPGAGRSPARHAGDPTGTSSTSSAAANLRNRIVRVLPHWSASVPATVPPRHVRVWARGVQSVRWRRPAAGAGAEPTDGGRCTPARTDGDAGRIDEGIAWLTSREGLGARQQLRLPQPLAPGPLPHGPGAIRRGAGALRRADPPRTARLRAPARRRHRAALAVAPRRGRSRRPAGDPGRQLGQAARHRARLLRLQRHARDDGLRHGGPSEEGRPPWRTWTGRWRMVRRPTGA